MTLPREGCAWFTSLRCLRPGFRIGRSCQLEIIYDYSLGLVYVPFRFISPSTRQEKNVSAQSSAFVSICLLAHQLYQDVCYHYLQRYPL